MNLFVLFVVAVLASAILTALLTVEPWTTNGLNTYFHHKFVMEDGSTVSLGKFDDCLKAATNSKELTIEKLMYEGGLGAVETLCVNGTIGIWRLNGPIGDFSISVKKGGETQPYFCDVHRDSIGNWHCRVSRF